jgi:protoheme IX farnesyltransferase
LLAGYVCVTGHMDILALLLFLSMATWQMAHFYAIGIFRYDDYQAAEIPIWPVKRGMKNTKIMILLYIIGFILCTIALGALKYTSLTYLLIVGIIGTYWLYSASTGFNDLKNEKWARKVFGNSLIVLLVMSTVLSLNAWMP